MGGTASQAPQFDTDKAKALDEKWEHYEVPEMRAEGADPYNSWEHYHVDRLEPLLDDIDLIDLAYIIENTELGRPVPRWQDVPRGARINRSNLHRIKEPIILECASILVLSYPWLDPEHPDKYLHTMKRLLPALKTWHGAASRKGPGHTVGLMMDYPCMPQKNINGEDDRTAEEKARFKRGLKSINEWYKHQHTTVIVFDVDLPPTATGHTNLRPYTQRGWCTFEFLVSGLAKNNECLWSLKGYEKTGKTTPTNLWDHAKNGAKQFVTRAAPMAPPDFEELLRKGVASGEIAFTAGADLDIVIEQYHKAFTSAFKEAEYVTYNLLYWKDSHALELAKALTYARKKGLLKMSTINLRGNRFSDVGVQAVRRALEGSGVSFDY